MKSCICPEVAGANDALLKRALGSGFERSVRRHHVSRRNVVSCLVYRFVDAQHHVDFDSIECRQIEIKAKIDQSLKFFLEILLVPGRVFGNSVQGQAQRTNLGIGAIFNHYNSDFVVAEVTDPSRETSLEEAQFEDPEFQVGDVMEIPVDFAEFGRSAVQAAKQRGEHLRMSDDEIAFYDALAANQSAIQAMGDSKLKVIAAELVLAVRKSVTIDWAVRDGARAKIKVLVKRILKKHGYPPDLQDEATKTVLSQAELLCADWVS